MLDSVELSEQGTSNGWVPGTGLLLQQGLQGVQAEVCAPAVLSEDVVMVLSLLSSHFIPQSMPLPLDPPFLCPFLGNIQTNECSHFQVCSRRMNSKPEKI